MDRTMRLAGLWLLIISMTVAVVILRGDNALRVETNLMALLPVVDRNDQVERAKRAVIAGVEQRLIYLVASETPSQAVNAARGLSDELELSGLFRQVGLPQSDQLGRERYQELYPHRYGLLSSRARHQLQTEPQVFIQERLQALYSPVGFTRAASIESDPLYLFGSYLEQMIPAGIAVDDGVLLLTDGALHYAVVSAELDSAAFDLEQQAQLLALTNQLRVKQAKAGNQLFASGLPLYAASGAERAQREIRLVGVGSCLGIILLLALSFGSLRPMLLALIAVATGVFGAWSISGLIFDQLHVLTLVFGASLVGVAVDYCLHYFCACLAESDTDSNHAKLKSVVRAMTLALITSATAYLCLATAPFPGLRQIAVFSTIGLMFSWLTVVALFPLLLRGMRWPQRRALLQKIGGVVDRWGHGLASHPWLTVGWLLALISGVGILHAEDDVRQLQTPDIALQQQDNHIKTLMPGAVDSRFFVVSGLTTTETLSHETLLTVELERLVATGAIAGYQSLTQIFPTAAQQEANYHLIKHSLYDSDKMRDYLQALGFSSQVIASEYRKFSQADEQHLTLTDWLTAVGEPWHSLWLDCDEIGCSSIVRLSAVKDVSALSALGLMKGVYLVDSVQQTSDLMAQYRNRAAWLLALGAVVALLLLSWRQGMRRGMAIMLVPVLSIAVTLGVLGWLGESLNLFRVFALLLVLGLGADFGIFAVQQRSLSSHTALAIVLSAATTLLAFGLLSLSDTEVVRSFGQTLLIGIGAALVLAPVAGRIKKA